jgi:signal transduction histidine kinase
MSLRSIGAGKNSEQFASAARNLVYLEQLVEEYLDKATSDTSGNSREASAESTVPVQVVLTAIADMFLDDMQARGKRFRVRPSRAVANANPMVVTRIVSNFVANALQYADKGGVLVGIRRRAGKAFIAVYDSGPGMDKETLERVVRRAERGDVDDAAQGKGLGLDIALSLARHHRLETIAESVPGKGSLFAVSIRADST